MFRFLGRTANHAGLTLRCEKDSQEVMYGLKRQVEETRLRLRILKVDEFVLEKRSLAGAVKIVVRGQIQPDDYLNARFEEESDERWIALAIPGIFALGLLGAGVLSRTQLLVSLSAIVAGSFIVAAVVNIIVLRHLEQLCLRMIMEAAGAREGTGERWWSGGR